MGLVVRANQPAALGRKIIAAENACSVKQLEKDLQECFEGKIGHPLVQGPHRLRFQLNFPCQVKKRISRRDYFVERLRVRCF